MAVLLFAVAVPVATASPARITARDRAATHAYLEADLALKEALVASAPTSTTALETLANKLRDECPGVLAGAQPKPPAVSQLPRTPKQRGEEERRRRQWSDLTSELSRVIGLSRDEPYQPAALAFAHKIRALRWSDQTVTAYEHALAVTVEWEVQGAPPPVCADMKAWVATGSSALSPATKALSREREPVVNRVVRLLKRLPEGPLALFSNPLSRYEGPREKALGHRITELEKQHDGALKSISNLRLDIELALGVINEAERRKFGKLPGALKPSPEGGHHRRARQPTIRTIVSARVPEGPVFSIAGTRRPSLRSDLTLEVELANELEAGGMQREEGEIGTAFPPRRGRLDPFAWEIRTGCQPHEFAIFYGILNASNDAVLVRDSSGLEPLRRARIPGSLHSHGVVAYVVLPTSPSELLVRAHNGKAIFAEKLVGVGREVRETCEGEAEGPTHTSSIGSMTAPFGR